MTAVLGEPRMSENGLRLVSGMDFDQRFGRFFLHLWNGLWKGKAQTRSTPLGRPADVKKQSEDGGVG